MLGLLMSKRNIGYLIRRISSVDLIHPMDSGQPGSSSSGELMEGASSAAKHRTEFEQQVDPGMEIRNEPVTVPQEKKKLRQFDISMSVHMLQ